MIIHATTHKVVRMVLAQAERRSFVPLVGLTAFLSALSMSVPVEWLVVAASLACRRRWMMIASIAAVGSAIASLGLYLGFHHFGWNLLLASYPELAGSQAWLQATDWLSKYGLLAIFGLMALPLPAPKLPMLAVAGIYRLPVADVFVVILVGKMLKYLAYAYLATRFPLALRSLTEHGGFVAGMATSREMRTLVVSSGDAERHVRNEESRLG